MNRGLRGPRVELRDVAGRAGVRELFPDIWLLPGERSASRIVASSFLLDGPRPTLVDAGMRPDAAAALRAANVVGGLHLTHLHLDHRVHQGWFHGLPTTCPRPEIGYFLDWAAWYEASGLPGEFAGAFSVWRQANFGAETLTGATAVDGDDDVHPGGFPALVIPLPGHTSGHSGLWFPDHRAALVTDYDMEKFGPWYGNKISDIERYIASLRALMARDDIEWFMTSHTREMMDRETFLQEARRYLQIIEDRESRLASELRAGPQTAADLIGKVRIYPPAALRRTPIFRQFELRMIELHLERLAQTGVVHRAEGSRWYAV